MAPTSFRLNTGQEMPAVGFGTWQAPPGQVAQAVETALRAGYRLIDAAYCYGNEAEVGAGLRAAFAAGVVKREDVFVVTKLWTTYTTRAALGLDKSLAALGLDYVDLYLVHWAIGMNPEGTRPDGGDADRFPLLPDGERDILWDHDHVATWKSLEALAGPQGKARAIGVCNYSRVYLENLLKQASVVPAVNQIENHPECPQQEVVDLCREKGIHVMAYSPLGSTGGPLLQCEPVVKLAEKKGVSPGTILLSYHVARGSTVLAKSVTDSRIKENLKIVDLDDEDVKLLTEGTAKKRYVYPPFGINFGFPDKPEGKKMKNGVPE